MQIPLRARILLFVAAINLLVFGGGLVFLAQGAKADRQRGALETCDALTYTLQQTIARGEIRVAAVLRWPNWHYFDDAILVRASFEPGPRGELRPAGAYLNPVGRASRRPDLDEAAVLADIVRAVEDRRRVESQGGLAIPVLDSEGDVWGGCWLLPDTQVDMAALLVRLASWFLISTAVLTAGTFFALRWFVLGPVDELARGSRLLAAGELGTRLAVPARKDELSELMRGFNRMAETVEGFNARLAHEVQVATENARRAEHAALTQQRLAATGELAAGIAHEINNPLGGLLNAIETLERRELPPEKRVQYLGLLRHGLERIQRTVGQLLRFTPRAPHTRELALIDPVLDAVGLVAWRARHQSVVVTLDGADLAGPGRDAAIARARTLPTIQGDQTELAQAVLNLLVNSLDALDAHRSTGGAGATQGRIAIRLEFRDGGLLLSITDDGPGVPAELLPRVADLFFTTKEVGKGTGLGLSIVHTIVASHGGRVLVFNAREGGFCAELWFPRRPGAGEVRR